MDAMVYKTAVETMQEGLLVVDTNGVILAANPAFLSMTGYSTGELVGKRCTILNCTGCKIMGEDSESGYWCMMFERGGTAGRKCQIMTKDGRIIHVVKVASVLHDEMGRITSAVETMKDVSELVKREEEIQSLRMKSQREGGFYGILGSSMPMRRLCNLIEDVALSDAPVMIYGESGVGKELVAHAVHQSGLRSSGNFIKVNCASLNENLLETELFGHVKGAFTGADRNRVGRFEAASGGSIFLDEIGDISPSIQVKLLRVIEHKEIERVGDHRPIPVDSRIISATNTNLEDLVGQGIFRADLFYRINVVPIYVPPLRDRKEDIPVLAQSFIDIIAARSGRPIAGLGRGSLDILLDYDWPGNVRELRNVIEYAFVLCREGLIEPEHLSPRVLDGEHRIASPSLHTYRSEDRNPLADASAKERETLIDALRKCGGNRTEAARILGVSRVTVWKRMKKHGVDQAPQLH
jgi:two-component system response regulator HydG